MKDNDVNKMYKYNVISKVDKNLKDISKIDEDLNFKRWSKKNEKNKTIKINGNNNKVETNYHVINEKFDSSFRFKKFIIYSLVAILSSSVIVLNLSTIIKVTINIII